MRCIERSGRVGLGAGLLLAVACQLGPDAPVANGASEQFVEGQAEFVPVTQQDTMSVGWYGSEMREMHEPRLHGARTPEGMTVIRFLWVRAFDPAVAVRMVESPGRCRVVVAIIGLREYRYGPPDSTGLQMVVSSAPGTVLRRDSTEVPPARCAEIHAQSVAAGLWGGPAKTADVGMDGDDVIFEIVDASGHRIAQRWSPRPGASPEFWEMAERFIAVGNVDPRMHYFAGDWSPWAHR